MALTLLPEYNRAIDVTGDAPHRRQMLAGASGRVVEIGAGNGMNFRHYPTTVDEVIALEPESYLRARAQAAAREAPVPVSVGDDVADELLLDDRSSDTAVANLVLCTVPIRRARWRSCVVSCAPAASCASSSTSDPTTRRRRASRRGWIGRACGRDLGADVTVPVTRSTRSRPLAST
jgi:Methyltransferase domain